MVKIPVGGTPLSGEAKDGVTRVDGGSRQGGTAEVQAKQTNFKGGILNAIIRYTRTAWREAGF